VLVIFVRFDFVVAAYIVVVLLTYVVVDILVVVPGVFGVLSFMPVCCCC